MDRTREEVTQKGQGKTERGEGRQREEVDRKSKRDTHTHTHIYGDRKSEVVGDKNRKIGLV